MTAINGLQARNAVLEVCHVSIRSDVLRSSSRTFRHKPRPPQFSPNFRVSHPPLVDAVGFRQDEHEQFKSHLTRWCPPLPCSKPPSGREWVTSNTHTPTGELLSAVSVEKLTVNIRVPLSAVYMNHWLTGRSWQMYYKPSIWGGRGVSIGDGLFANSPWQSEICWLTISI